jgi:GTPase SAR1 family protein
VVNQPVTVSIKVVLCGPPQSGKSCLREGLKKAIRSIPNAPYPFVITANPDGEGSWFAQTAQRNPEEARKYKTEHKTEFTPEFVKVRADWVKNCTEVLTLIDVGGQITPENKLIMQHATHAVILSREANQVAAWRDFCRNIKLCIIAIIHSDYYGECDGFAGQGQRLESEFPILTGSVHRLQRGEDVSERPMVQALARLLVGLCSG